MLVTYVVNCPYCGENFQTGIDLSAGSQQYVEDCYVCCRPIQFRLDVDHDGDLVSLYTMRDDE